jgi:hypothetical protein
MGFTRLIVILQTMTLTKLDTVTNIRQEIVQIIFNIDLYLIKTLKVPNAIEPTLKVCPDELMASKLFKVIPFGGFLYS